MNTCSLSITFSIFTYNVNRMSLYNNSFDNRKMCTSYSPFSWLGKYMTYAPLESQVMTMWSSHSQACLIIFPSIWLPNIIHFPKKFGITTITKIMHGVSPFSSKCSHQLSKTIGVIHIEKKVTKNVKRQALLYKKN